MATSYGTIIGHPDYAKLPPEKKQSIAQQYWKDDPIAADAVALIQETPEDLSSIQQKAFDDRRKISALRIASREPEAAQYQEQINAGLQEAEENLTRLNAIYTPEAQGDIEALVEPAKNTGWYGSLPLENQLGRVGVGYSPEQYQEIYNSQRDATAQKYGLTTEQLDDVVRHQMDAQEKPVSRDALGRVHIKNDVFIQGLDAVKKNVEDSDLPQSIKEQELEGIDERYKGFQEAVVANTLQNHKDYAKEIGLDASKSVDENFKKIGESLNTSTLENEFSSAVQATRQGGAALLRGLGTAAEAISPEAAGESGLKKTADQLDQRKKIFESQLALSKEFNNDKLSIFGLTPGAIGQGIGSVVESAVIARATGGIIPKVGGAGKLAGYLNSVRGVAPTAAIMGTRTGLQTYDDAKKQGLSEEDAIRAGLASGIIEAGTTLAFTASGARSIEEIASGMKKTIGPSVKSAFKEATKDVTKGTLAEVTEESIINALDQALVQTTVRPGMTTDQFLQSVKDTAIATLIAAGPITGASGVATYNQTNEQLRERANAIAEENLPAIENEGGDESVSGTPSLAEERAALIEQLPNLEGDERLAVEERIAEIDNELPASETAPAAQVEPVVEETIESPAQAEVPTDSLPEGQTTLSDQGGVVTLNEDGQETQIQDTEETVSADGGLEPEQLQDTSGELETNVLDETTPNPPTAPGTGVEATEAIPTRPPETNTEVTTPQASTTTPVEENVIRATNAAIDRDLARLNQPPIAAQARQKFGVIWDEAVTEARAEPLKASRLITELAGTRVGADGNFVGGKPRSVTTKEQASILYEYAQRKVRAGKTRAEINTTTNPALAQTLQEKLQLDLSDMRQAAVANRIAGAETARSLSFRQVGIDEESYDLVSMQNRFQSEINNGQKLTKQQEAEVRELNSRILATEDEVVAAQEEAYARGRVDAEKEFLDRLKAEGKPRKRTQKDKVDALNRQIAEAKKRIRDRFKGNGDGRVFSGLPYTEKDVVDVAIIATAYIRKGVVSLQAFTNNLVKEFGEGIRPYAEQVFAESKNILVNSGLVKSNAELVQAIDPSKPLNRQTVWNMAKNLIQNGVPTNQVIDEIHNDLKSKWKDISRQEVSDAFTGYGREINPTRSELSRELADLRRAERLERQIGELRDGNYKPKPKTPREKSDRIKALEAERDELVKNSKVKKSGEDKLVDAINKRTAAIRERISKGDFTKEPRQTREESKRIRDARLANAKAKEGWDRKFFEQQLKNQTKVQKALRILVEPVNLSRTIITSLDLPPIFRQGMLVTLTRPSIALKNFPKSVAAGVSEARALEIEENIRNHPEYNLAKAAKLSLTESGPYASLSQQEEEFRGRWAKKIPGVNIVTNFSERNYVSYLNSIRMDLFSTMVKSLSVTGNPTVAEAKLIANYVNNVSGRGDLGKLEGSMSALSAIFFSPRYWASRVNTVLGAFPVIFDVTTGFKFREADVIRARKAIAKEYARALIGYGVLYGSLLYGAAGLLDDDDELKIEWDLRSSDFGKIKIGKSRFDPLAGMGSNIVFVSRFLSNSSKNLKTGKVTEKDGNAFIGLIASYVRGKLAPLPGAVINYKSGEDIIGNRTTARTELTGLFLPLSPQDIYEQFKEFGPVGGIGSAFATLMGLGTQIHDDGLTPKQQIAIVLGDDPGDLKPKPKKGKSRFNLR